MDEQGPFHPHVQAVLAAIRQLTLVERRRLQRRLRVSGLLVQDELLTDQNRLHIAPALGEAGMRRVRARGAPRARTTTSPPAPAEAFVPASTPVAPAPSQPSTSPSSQPPAPPEPETYRSSVSGKVVIGGPEESAAPDPHVMHPVPGQGPEQPIVVIFDGGSRGNPGRGYGSYALRWPGQPEQIVQLQFGDHVTNNEAEYDTLIAALEAILKRLADLHASAQSVTINIFGDSLLVINQVTGAWDCKDARMRTRRDQARRLLAAFGHTTLTHHSRDKSVEILGH
jgi:ribonuclease HI